MERTDAAGLSAALRLGLVVIAVLAVLTVIEWFVGTEMDPNLIPMAAIAFVKAALIVWYFMHLYRLWQTEEAH